MNINSGNENAKGADLYCTLEALAAITEKHDLIVM